MALMNFKPYKISGERKKDIEDIPGEISRNYQFEIKSIKRKKTDELGDHLVINFFFEVEYRPDFGKVSLEGSIVYKHSELEKMCIGEEDNLKLSKEAYAEVSNAFMRASLIELIEVSRKIHLPIPISLPRLEL